MRRSTESIFAASETISHYLTLKTSDIDLSALGETRIGDMVVEVVDPVAVYATLMEKPFHLKAIHDLLETGFQIRLDAMDAITGPCAVEILERRLGAAPAGLGGLCNTVAGFWRRGYPDPNPVRARELRRPCAQPRRARFPAPLGRRRRIAT